MEEKLDRLLQGFFEFKENMEGKMDSLENHMDGLENRIGKIENRMDSLEERMERGFSEVHTAINELNLTQRKILNSIDLLKEDIRNNRRHIEALEEKEKYV